MNRKTKTDAIFNLIYQLMVIFIPLVTTPYLSRVLGVDNIGIQSYTLSIVSYFTLFAAFGLNDYGQREIARIQDDKNKVSKLFLEMIVNRFITTFMVLILYMVMVFTTLEANYKIYYLIMVMNVVAIAFDITWFFQGIEKFKSLAIRNMLIKLISMLFIFIFVKSTNDLWIYVLINSLSLILSSISMWFLIPKNVNMVKISFKDVLKHYKGTLVYFIPTIAIQIYTVLDKTMINWITGSTLENGVYEQAEKLVKVSLTIIQFMNTIMRSRMTYLFEYKHLDEAKKICDQSLEFLSILIFPATAGIILIAPNLIPLYLGEGYEKSIILLQMFSFLVIFIGYSGFIASHYMTPIGKQKQSNIALIIGSIINVVLNLFLIKPYGAIGATIASVFAEFIIALIYMYNAKGFIKYTKYLTISYKKMIAAIIMFLVTFFTTKYMALSDFLMILVKVSIAVGTYFVVLLILHDNFIISYIRKLSNVLKALSK